MIEQVSTSTSLDLAAPWHLYRAHISESLAKWCKMCDQEQSTLTSMKVTYPSVLRFMSLKDYDSSSRHTLEEQLGKFFLKLEHMLPEEHKECLIYALILVERGFS